MSRSGQCLDSMCFERLFSLGEGSNWSHERQLNRAGGPGLCPSSKRSSGLGPIPAPPDLKAKMKTDGCHWPSPSLGVVGGVSKLEKATKKSKGRRSLKIGSVFVRPPKQVENLQVVS